MDSIATKSLVFYKYGIIYPVHAVLFISIYTIIYYVISTIGDF